jgi:HPt (histidine-containing phosphotransfer) domain-containing protein
MDEYISKPIRREELMDALARILPASSHPVADSDHDEAGHRDRPVADLARLLQELGGDEAVLERMVELYEETTPKFVQNLKQALSEGNCDAVRAAAHTLKGSAAQFWARPAEAAALALEKSAIAGDLGRTESQMAALEAALTELGRALRESLPGLKQGQA